MLNVSTAELTDDQLGKRGEETLKTIKFDPIGDTPWLKSAKACLGLPSVNQTPASFVNLMLISCDLPQAKENSIEAFAFYGKDCAPIEGAICIFEGYKHIGFLSDIKDSNSISIISCNKATQVIEERDASEYGEIIAYKRPSNFVI